MKSIFTIIDEINREILDQDTTSYAETEDNQFIQSALCEARDVINGYVTKEGIEKVDNNLESMLAFHYRVLIAYNEYAQFCETIQAPASDKKAINTIGVVQKSLSDSFEVQREVIAKIQDMISDKIAEFTDRMHL